MPIQIDQNNGELRMLRQTDMAEAHLQTPQPTPEGDIALNAITGIAEARKPRGYGDPVFPSDPKPKN